MVIIGLCHLSSNSIDFKFIFHTICSEFQFIHTVIQLIFTLCERCFFQSQLAEYQFFGLIQSDISIFGVIIFIHSHRAGIQVAGLYRAAYTFGNILQKIIIGITGTLFEFDNDVFGVAAYSAVKITVGVDFFHQIFYYRAAGLAFISGKIFDNGFSLFVKSLNLQHTAAVVIIDFDFGVNTQQDGSHSLILCAAGRVTCYRTSGRAAAGGNATGQNSEAESGSGNSDGLVFQSCLFHDVVLLYHKIVWNGFLQRLCDGWHFVLFALMYKEYGMDFSKTGSGQTFFKKFWKNNFCP